MATPLTLASYIQIVRRNRNFRLLWFAQIVSEMSRQVAADLREDNEKLEQKVDGLERSVDTLRLRVVELTDALRGAISRLDEYGHDTDPLRAVLNGRNGAGR